MASSAQNYQSQWQESVVNIAYGTLFLAASIMLGYYLVITNTLNGNLSYYWASFICAFLAYASFTVLHDAGHGNIIKEGSALKPVESMLGWLFSLPSLILPFRFFQKIHDRHHAFTNDPDRDPDHYKYNNSLWMLMLNCLYIPIQYYVLVFTKLKNNQTFQKTYLSSACYFAITTTAISLLCFYGYAFEILIFAVIPNIAGTIIITLLFDYIPHHPHKSRDRYHDTRIYPGKLLNLLLLGQNYHLLHHMYPRIPWYKYQALYQRVLPDLIANNAPIEDVIWGNRPRFLKSSSVRSLLKNGDKINMVLNVVEVRALTTDAVAITFELPEGEHLNYKAGQYIMISKWLANEQQTRCYSLCSSPLNYSNASLKNELKIGVRKTTNGLVSTFLNHDLKAGDKLIVQGPFGDFIYPTLRSTMLDHLVLIAGGSGITPILAIIETALSETNVVECGQPAVTLIYACRSRESIMFYDELVQLARAHPKQLTVRYIIEQSITEQSCIEQGSIPQDLVAKDAIESIDLHGILDADNLNVCIPELAEHKSNHKLQNTDFYICGPAGLKNGVVSELKRNGVEQHQIHVEEFVSSTTEPIGDLHTVNIVLADGNKHALKVAANQTVLEVAKTQGVQLPHACGSGTCGTCKFKIEQGKTEQIPNTIPGITEEEKLTGLTLACQCRPLEDIVMSEP